MKALPVAVDFLKNKSNATTEVFHLKRRQLPWEVKSMPQKNIIRCKERKNQQRSNIFSSVV